MAEPKPWTAEQQRVMKARLDNAAKQAASDLGAYTVLVIAWFEQLDDPMFLHRMDGAFPYEHVVRAMASDRERSVFRQPAVVVDANSTDDGSSSSGEPQLQ